MSKRDSLNLLTSKIITARDKYYNYGNSPYTDQEYDAMINTLAIMDPGNSLLTEVGSPVKGSKVYRNEPMFTLSKVTDEKELKVRVKLLLKDGPIHIYPKYDGASCSLLYEGGKLKLASTRGTGYVGENITEFAMKCSGIPKDISRISKGLFEVRGECIIPKISHESLKIKCGYTAMRNAVVGIMRSAPDKDICDKVHFVAYEVNYQMGNIKHLTRRDIEEILSTHFETEELLGSYSTSEKTLDFIKSFNKDKYEYELDGLVIKPSKLCDIGETIPKYMFAWKYETLIKYSSLTGIEAKVGVTGKINIVYKFYPVEFQGAKISSASAGSIQLHNTKWKGVVGDVVGITRINDVIPVIKDISNISPEQFKPILYCPCCNEELVNNTCCNPLCRDRQILRMCQYVAGFKIKGLGSSIFSKLYDSGFQTIASLYKVSDEDLRKIPRVGNSLIEKFQKFQKTKISFKQFLCYYPFDNIGESFITDIMNKFPPEDILDPDTLNMVKDDNSSKYSKFYKTICEYNSDIKEVWNIVQA